MRNVFKGIAHGIIAQVNQMTNYVNEVYVKTEDNADTFITREEAVIRELVEQRERERQTAPGIGVQTRQTYALLALLQSQRDLTNDTLQEAMGKHDVFLGVKQKRQIRKAHNAGLIGQVEGTESITLTRWGLATLDHLRRQLINAGISTDIDELHGGRVRKVTDAMRANAFGRSSKNVPKDEDQGQDQDTQRKVTSLKRKVVPGVEA